MQTLPRASALIRKERGLENDIVRFRYRGNIEAAICLYLERLLRKEQLRQTMPKKIGCLFRRTNKIVFPRHKVIPLT